jgi:plastocyanin
MRTTFFSKVVLFTLLSLTCTSLTRAATHVIEFGGALGNRYSPSGLQVAIGDVITWNGDFSAHPLSSVSVPAGAATFSNSSGTTFSYTVAVAGNYGYRCNFHFSEGMVGGFAAAGTSGVSDQQKTTEADLQIFPNPVMTFGKISFESESVHQASLELYDLTGKLVMSLTQPVGSSEIMFDASSLPRGEYFARVRTRGYSILRSLVKK